MESKRQRPEVAPLDPRVVGLIRTLAGEYADKYASEYVLGHLGKLLSVAEPDRDSIANSLEDPINSLVAYFGHYAFARRGKDREALAKLSVAALKQVVSQLGARSILGAEHGQPLWEEFARQCEQKGRKIHELQDRGPVQGVLELAQEIERISPGDSIATWVEDTVLTTGQLEPIYARIVDIRGVGPKNASTFLRDICWIFDIEKDIIPQDRLVVQPIDRWMRQIVPYVVPEQDLKDPADWVIAGKVSKYVRRAGVSEIAFNMGVTYFGQSVARSPERLASALRELVIPGA